MKIGKYYLVHPETKSVFRLLVTSTKDMGEFTGVTPEFPAVHVSNRDKRSGKFRNYDRVSWYDKWRSNKTGELAPCPKPRITEQGIYYSDVAEKIWNYLVTKGYVRDAQYNWDHSEKTQEQLQMDKWYHYKEAVRQFIEHTAERWMQTQLKQKVWNNTFLQKLMICKKLLFVLFLIQRATPTITKSSTCRPYGINRP